MNSASYVLAVVVVGSGIFALGSYHVAGSNAAYAGAVATPSAAPAATSPPITGWPGMPKEPSPDATVDTNNFAYAPAVVSVKVGGTVRFTNSDAMSHTVTADDRSFDSKNMSEGDSWSHVFKTAGTYTYYCAYHHYMHGKVIVK